MVWGFDIFQKFVVKFLAHEQIIPVKCTKISSGRYGQGKMKIFQGQGKVREFFKKSGNSVFWRNASRLAMGL